MERFIPAEVPFTFHWKVGVIPLLCGTALKVTGLPVQTGFKEGEIVMDTSSTVVTSIRIVFEVAGLLEVHKVLEEESIQVIISEFRGM